MANRRKTAPEIRAEMIVNHALNLSVSTVQRRLREVGLKAHNVRKKPHLTKEHKRKRVEFARCYKNYTVLDWLQVVFSDTSQFQLFRNNGRAFVLRKPGEVCREDCTEPMLEHGGGSVMVWGCMSESSVGVNLLCTALPSSVQSLSSSRTLLVAIQQNTQRNGYQKQTLHCLIGLHKV